MHSEDLDRAGTRQWPSSNVEATQVVPEEYYQNCLGDLAGLFLVSYSNTTGILVLRLTTLSGLGSAKHKILTWLNLTLSHFQTTSWTRLLNL